MSNVIELSVFKGARSPTSSEKGEQIESSAWGRRCRRSARNMHNLVFRSYGLIVEAPEADLVRDVRVNTDKAKVKLRKIREQIVIDRDKAAARAEMMSKAETKLSAAIEAAAVQPSEQPPAKYDPTRRREFDEAMRRRINIVALFRDLSEEDCRPVLTLKHHEIAKFTEKHGVNLEWLLEGKGSVFKNSPIAPNSVMSGAEFAALVRTLPEAEQRKIKAVIDLFLEDRSR